MLESYVPPKLVEELKTVFPNHLPTAEDWLGKYDKPITFELIAYRSGFQACISFLEEQVILQKERSSNDLKII